MHQATPSGETKQGLAQNTPLLTTLLAYLDQCGKAFKRRCAAQRARDFILGLLLAQGRKTCMASRYWRNLADDESADLKIFSRSEWDVRFWFRIVVSEAVATLAPGAPVIWAMDDTGLRRWGKRIPQARYIHDPLALKWLKQRMTWGVRTLHSAILLPLQDEAGRPYAISSGFYPKPAAKKPYKRQLTGEALAAYQAAKKATVLTREARKEIEWARVILDELGHSERQLLVVVDGSFMNGPIAREAICGVHIVGRTRKDIRLYWKGAGPGRTFYGDRLPTPEEIRQSHSYVWRKGSFHWGGRPRDISYKIIGPVFWKDGTRKRPLRLIILQGSMRKVSPRTKQRRKTKRNFDSGDPAYLLTTDLNSDPKTLIQAYLDRWQIEVLHRDLKSGVGVAHPQSTSFEAVERIPAAMAAAYALLTLAVLKVHGPSWSAKTVPQTAASRRRALRLAKDGREIKRRFSRKDMIALLRNEVERAGMFQGAFLPGTAPTGWGLSPRESLQDR